MCFDVMKNQEKNDMIIKQAGSERSIKWYNGTIENLRLRAVYYWLSEDYIKLKGTNNTNVTITLQSILGEKTHGST